jgi:hypothetical protein
MRVYIISSYVEEEEEKIKVILYNGISTRGAHTLERSELPTRRSTLSTFDSTLIFSSLAPGLPSSAAAASSSVF